MKGYYYLATPYSNYPGGHDAAADAADRETGLLIAAGINVMSPIAHCHRLFKSGYASGGDWETWKNWNTAMISSARGVIVCALEGWRESRGVQEEILLCQKIGVPLTMMTPGVVPEELRLVQKSLLDSGR
jgi:hypothetical protein